MLNANGCPVRNFHLMNNLEKRISQTKLLWIPCKQGCDKMWIWLSDQDEKLMQCISSLEVF